MDVSVVINNNRFSSKVIFKNTEYVKKEGKESSAFPLKFSSGG